MSIFSHLKAIAGKLYVYNKLYFYNLYFYRAIQYREMFNNTIVQKNGSIIFNLITNTKTGKPTGKIA